MHDGSHNKSPDTQRALAERILLAERRIVHLEQQLQEIRSAAQHHLERAERVRAQVEAGAKAYRQQMRSTMAEYRRQRAWRVMLLLRACYTAAARTGIFRAAARLLSKRRITANLRHVATPGGAIIAALYGCLSRWIQVEEVTFPDIDAYLPAAISVPLAADVTQLGAPEPISACASPAAFDIIVFPVFEFDFRFQRPQQVAVQFARQGHRVFWISPARRPVTARSYEAIELQPNLWEVRVNAACPNIYGGELDSGSARELTDCLAELYKDWLVSESMAVLQLPFWHAVGVALRSRFGTMVVYDCMDDWDTMPGISMFNRTEQAALVKDCDLLLTSSGYLRERYAGVQERCALVRNGVDHELFGVARSAGHLGHTAKPIIGYFGAIANWFDYDLVCNVAALRPNYSFVLLGGFGLEEHPSGENIARLRHHPNIHLLGHKSYNEIPSYAADFDVAMIPFLITDVTRATDPVKFYEYMSLGKPVVATPMPEVAQYSDLVYIASKPEDFASQLDRALAQDSPERRRARKAFAESNTWEARCREIRHAVRPAFPKVSVLIVTYNSEAFISPCLDSILDRTVYPNFEVLVADNGSTDGSLGLLSGYAARDERITVLPLGANRGFAAANNILAREAAGEYLVLLNIDTIVTRGWIGRLLNHIRNNPSIGIVVPVTNWIGNEARINCHYWDPTGMEEFAREIARTNTGLSRELTVAPLFCALIPKKIWTEVGELDECFEIGMFEDDDYSMRVRRRHYRIVTAEDCFIHHFGGGSFAKLDQAAYKGIFNLNRQRFERKWNVTWVPHRHREGVRPEFTRFDPAAFAIRPLAALAGNSPG